MSWNDFKIKHEEGKVLSHKNSVEQDYTLNPCEAYERIIEFFFLSTKMIDYR